MGSTIAIGAANQLVITLPMGTFTAGDTIAIRYTDPSAANDSSALQDAAGNDIANFTTTSFSVIDGYVRNAKIYIDTNGNGIAEDSEFTGVVTDENGSFFLPTNRPAGAIIATGGVNIDTGVANTIEFKAPTESTVLTPLTTLIQAYIAANKVDAANAENAIKAALGIPDNIDLLNYDPLAEAPGNADALAVQKIAASIATIITLAAGSNNVLENTVISNLVTAIKDANNSTTTIDFTDNSALNTIVSNTGTNVQAVSDATTAINNANSFQDISDAQSEALDNISPAIPTLLRLSDSADTGIKGDATTNISNSTIRVSFNITATDGTAAVAGDNITIYNGSNPVGAINLTATDISNGYADISTQLSPGSNSLTAQITDAVFHKSAFSTATVFVLDNTPPSTPSISLLTDSTDSKTGHDADGITNNANLVFSTAAADVTRTYTINNGSTSSSYVAPTNDGTYTVLVTDTDVAGNASSTSITFTLDTSATAPVWTNATGGVLASDGTVNTNDSTPAIGGTAEAGVTIHVYNALGSANLPEGALLGTVIAGADGKWSLQLPQLPDGEYRARAEAVDAAGNVSALALGPLLRVDTTNNPADIAQPYVVSASFTEGANATITLTYSEPMQIVNTTPYYPWSGINITGASVVNNTVTLTTDQTLTATDIVELDPYGSLYLGIKDLAGNYPLERFTIIGGSGDNELVAFYYNSYGIFAGDGADVITVGDRDDIVNFAETIKSSDKVVVNGNDEASTWVLMDNIIGFDVSSNATNDLLDLPSSAIAGNTSGFVNGIDAGTIKSHSVSNGIVTFGSADTGVAITINETNRADVITYLAKNLSTPGLTVGIEIDTDSDGSDDSLIVYQPQGGDIEDVAITLTGITGLTLGNMASNDVVQITDSQGPMLTSYPTITSNTITFSFNEVISNYDLTGLSFKHGNGQTLTDIAVTGTSNNANSITLTTDTTFGANDYVLVTVTDKAQVFARDSNSNTAEVFYTDIGFHAAIGGVGNSIIDLSGLTYSDPTTHSTIADLAGGNDTLISGAAGFFELDGGIGNDILDARLSSNADLFGGDGNDVLYGAQHSNEYTGGKGADKITGSTDAQSENLFLFLQGDSTSVTFRDQGSAGLSNGDTFTFNNGADIILGGFNAVTPQTDPLGNTYLYGDSINLYSDSYSYHDIDLSHMATMPQNGLTTNQGYFFQQGSYAEANGIFTVNDTGSDALIVYDGDATAGISQTALVIANVNSAYLFSDRSGNILLEQPPVI